MKKIAVFLTLALLVVGCSRTGNLVGPVSPADQGMSTMTISIQLDKIVSLEKTKTQIATPKDSATYIMVWGVIGTGGSMTRMDSIPIANVGSSVIRHYSLPKNQPYDITIYAQNDVQRFSGPTQFNFGEVSGTVPTADSFAVSVTCQAMVDYVHFIVPVKNSSVQNTLINLSLSWVENVVGRMPTNGSDSIAFSAGSVDTVSINDVLYFADNYSDGVMTNPPTSYTFSTTLRSNNGSYYQGSGTVIISPTGNSTLVIPLTYYGGGNSLAKLTVVLNAVGIVSVTVSGI